LTAALRECHGSVTDVAKALGITPRAVRMKLRAHGLNATAFR